MFLFKLYYFKLIFRESYLSSGERLSLINILNKISLYTVIRLGLLFFSFLKILYTLF